VTTLDATRHTDVAIVGGGLAGSLAAAMLGRAGIGTVLIDPHPAYPADFRCEKLDGFQTGVLAKTGLLDHVRQAATPDGECWIARFGRVVDRRPGDQLGIMYDTLVNTIRAAIPTTVAFVHGKASEIATSADRQQIRLASGETISARLVVLANGLNVGLRQKLGMERQIISAGHSISIGFDAKPVDRPAFGFPALTYFNERPAERMAFVSLFPIGSVMRANLFGYRDMHDPWLRQLRAEPQQTLYASMPRLRRLMGDFVVTDFLKIRPVDLYVTHGHRQAGVVLVGDAFSTSCPAAGTGARKALVDVERLCNLHIPQWLATPGMGKDKIAAFYDDPDKLATDTYSHAKAYSLRSFSVETGLRWRAERFGKFVAHRGIGLLRQLRGREAPPADDQPDTHAGSSARPLPIP
jgi:2-polyprenyl-6-methoxyphenol hydroxylase-like FAD-dependent oxidoreductase